MSCRLAIAATSHLVPNPVLSADHVAHLCDKATPATGYLFHTRYGSAGDFTASITWGDGATGTGRISGTPSTFYVWGWHIFPAVGTYIYKVTVKDDGGSTCNYTGGITVSGAPLAVNVPPQTASCTCYAQTQSQVRSNTQGNGNPMAVGYSVAPVRYFDGLVQLVADDGLSSDGFGLPWGQTRSWANAPGYTNTGWQGFGWSTDQLPVLLGGGSVLEVATAAGQARFFDGSGSTWTERFFLHDSLNANGTAHTYTFIDEAGDQFVFDDFSSNWMAPLQGQLVSATDPYGNVTTLSYNSGGALTQMQRSGTLNGTSVIEQYVYVYGGTNVPAGFLKSVTLQRSINGGQFNPVRKVTYSYYDGSQPGGNWGDLDTATLSDGVGNVLSTQYYRYRLDGAVDFSYAPLVDLLSYSFSTTSYERVVNAVGNPALLSDSTIAPYADEHYVYDNQARVTSEVAQGLGCSACAGGLGTFSYSYTAGGHTGYNAWSEKTVVTLPDGNQDIAYTNSYGELMLLVYQDSTTHQQWDSFDEYDNSGRVILHAEPSAVTGYSESYADLLGNQNGNYLDLSDSSGLLEQYDWSSTTTATATTAGSVAGYLADVKLKQGELGNGITQESWQYYQQSVNGLTVDPLASATLDRNSDGTGAQTTSYAYTWVGGTVGVQSMTTTAPVIAAGQNGPGVADVSTVFFDGYGHPVWSMDADGFITYAAYDLATGAVLSSIEDVNTSLTNEFSGLPSGWSTPAGGGLNLVTSYQVDGLGRPTKETDPNGNISYWVYNDAQQWVRTYQGWNAASGTPTGPTIMERDDPSGTYVEALSMTATPHLTNGVPDGTEAVSGVQTLSRTLTNAAGQYVEQDDYFNLNGLPYSTAAQLGSANVNYYATYMGYDDRGRQDRVQTPNGTIYRTVFDGLNRPVSDWVGTNDSPANGQEWEPSNNTAPANMVQLDASQYDGGGVGDGNRTQYIVYPGLGAAAEVRQAWYDWRDRPVAEKDGVQASEDSTTHRPLVYTTYDNLDEATQVQQYDGDGVTISTVNGVPQAPASNLLRAQTNVAYDDQGRVYQTQVYDVNPTTGAVSSSALTANDYYDHRGNLVAESAPGGLWSKSQYDGAGRDVFDFTTDGASATSWAAATSVTNDNVLEQTQTVYDAAGNAIETIDKQRFHNETATGPLGTPTTGPLARVYYAAAYYDAANRLTATVDMGTNGGTAWTRPASVPAASATALVSSIAYNGAGWVQDTTDPNGIDTRQLYDNLGRVTKSITDYTDGTVTAETNATTEYSYDGNNHVLTVQADEPGGALQQTKYVYGVTTVGGSAVNSNDLLATVQHPDPTTGQPSAGQQDSYEVNALGQLAQYTDRNGNVHQYAYDILGRLTSDAVTTLGAGVDGTVRRIGYSYGTQGNLFQATSYDAPTGGNILNQVQLGYNGLGQLTAEYQSHSGAVNTSSTPVVQYAYTEMAGGANNSRLVSMTYPNGRVLNYNYATGLDNNISRLTSISDSSGALESYKYLGLNTVVERDHPQSNVKLTYIQQGNDPNANHDGGDQYTGLDRFGRVIDQNWYNATTQASTDRFQYGYNADSNVLYKNNLVAPANSELYTYDALQQLSSFQRGTLNSTNTGLVGNPSHSQSWSLDALGNFSSVTTDGSTQTRTANQQNEITSISSAGAVTYDANGNLTADGSGNQYVYDAWNRLISVSNNGSTLAQYGYGALGRRVTETHGSTSTDLYYNIQWQVIEERQGSNVLAQNVWGPSGIDILVLRDQSSQHNGMLDQRLYVQQDANGNVTALVGTSGNVLERFIYDPYGAVTVLNPDWSVRGISAYAWMYLYQARRYDGTLGIYDSCARVYSPDLMRWLQVDPLAFGAGDPSVYRYTANNPVTAGDPTGLTVAPLPTGPRIGAAIASRLGDWFPLICPWWAFEPPPQCPPPDTSGIYYPPESRDMTTNKVAIISDCTPEPADLSWVPRSQQHKGIGEYSDFRDILNGYKDGSIDVLVVFGHQGGHCSARTNGSATFGGTDMPNDIYSLIRKKLSPNGHIVMEACNCGATPGNVQKFVEAVRVPVTVSPKYMRARGQGAWAGGGAADKGWYTVYPGMSIEEITKLRDKAIGMP